MEYVSKINIFGLKMMVNSGLEKIILKFLHVKNYCFFIHKNAQNCKFSNENDLEEAWPECTYNPITAMGFSAMFTFQLDNTKR
jgi:hypothetical protein